MRREEEIPLPGLEEAAAAVAVAHSSEEGAGHTHSHTIPAVGPAMGAGGAVGPRGAAVGSDRTPLARKSLGQCRTEASTRRRFLPWKALSPAPLGKADSILLG